MLKLATAVGAALLVSVAVPATGFAVTQIPNDTRVSARVVDGKIVALRFSRAAFRDVAGKRVVIACTEMGDDPGQDGIYSEGIGSEAFRMPKRRRVVRRYVGPGYDYCTLRARRRHIVTVAISERGKVVVDEQYLTLLLMTVIASDAARSALEVTPLASPADTPPAGSVGYYSDGAEHAAAVTISAAGRRLFLEVDADDVLRTNVAKYLYAGIL